MVTHRDDYPPHTLLARCVMVGLFLVSAALSLTIVALLVEALVGLALWIFG